MNNRNDWTDFEGSCLICRNCELLSLSGSVGQGSPTHFLRYCITKVPSLCLKVVNDSVTLRLCVSA